MRKHSDERFSDHHEVNAALIRTLVAPYGLKVHGYRWAKDGMHTVLLLRTDRGPAVLKMYRQWGQQDENLTKRFTFLNFLKSRRLPVPQTFAEHSGQLVGYYSVDDDTWLYVLMERLGGRYLRHADTALIPDMASLQAALHRTAAAYAPSSASQANLADDVEYLAKLCRKATRHPEYGVPVTFLWAAEEAHTALTNSLGWLARLPSGLVHRDYDSNNILVHNGKISGIIDWDDLSDLPFVADLGNSIWWWLVTSRETGQEGLVHRYLNAYRRGRKLSAPELSALPLFVRMQNCTTALADHVKRREPYSAARWQLAADLDAAAIEWRKDSDVDYSQVLELERLGI